MLSRHDTIRALFYGAGRLDVYSLYVHMHPPYLIYRIMHDLLGKSGV